MAKHKRLKPIGGYLYDKGEMIEQMFSSIPIVEIRNMVPIKLQGMPLHELKAECLVELLGMSDREIINIVHGKKERTLSSSESEREDAFVISDDERRIKKEKKEAVIRKIERVSSKKDIRLKQNSPEPSSSKKKRKSKEEVKSKRKKKKSEDRSTTSIPSGSKEVEKAPVGKKKKDEKKKDTPTTKDEDDVVVLDDDSDKEEKREQKSLLDLLELEMRARAIRSLLKKEERSHSQKILSEYKDEPDDLIPIEIEPPHIELLSDSDEEAGNGSNLKENECAENVSDFVSSKIADNLREHQENSRSSLASLNNDSISCDAFETLKVTSADQKQVTLENDTDQGIKGDDFLSVEQESHQIASKDDEVVHDDTNKSGDSVPTNEPDSESRIVASAASSSKDLRKETATDHFLVCEEPSVAMMDGSQHEENPVSLMPPVSGSNYFTEDKIDPVDQRDTSAEHDLLPLPSETEHSLVNVDIETSNRSSSKSSLPVPERDTNCDTVAYNSTTPATSMLNVDNCAPTDKSVEGDFHDQTEDEALDYDYNPTASHFGKQSEDPPCLLSNTEEEQILPERSSIESEQIQNNQVENCDTFTSDEHCAVFRSESQIFPETVAVSDDVTPVLSRTPLETSADNFVGEADAECKKEVSIMGSEDVSMNQHGANGCHEDTGGFTQTLQQKTETLNEEAVTTQVEELCHRNSDIHGTSDVEGIDTEDKEIRVEEAECSEVLSIEPPDLSSTKGKEVSLVSACEPEKVYTSQDNNESVVENTLLSVPEADTCSSLPSAISHEEVDSISTVNEDILTFPTSDAKPPESASLTLSDSSGGVIFVDDRKLKQNSNSPLPTNNGVTESCAELANEQGRISDEVETAENAQLSTRPIFHASPSEVVEIIDETNGADACETSGTVRSPLRSLHETSLCLINERAVAEIIDITEEPLERPDVVIMKERSDSESNDDSDNEMLGNTDSILEKMNNILNDEVPDDVDSVDSDCSQSCSTGTSEVPAEILSVDSECSSSETGDESDGSEQPQDPKLWSVDDVVELLDDDDVDVMRSNMESTSHCHADTSRTGNIDETSIEIIDDDSSSSSVCSVNSQQNLKSYDSVIMMHPNDSKSDDWVVINAESSTKNNCALAVESDGSKSRDCAIVSQPADTRGCFVESNPENTVAEASGVISSLSAIHADQDSAAVTIVIEDEGEEEATLLTKEVPAEVFELEDDDEEGKTNWTARWLESDHVKKVVKTSKIWTNVRKQMKMKLKKSEAPVVSDDPKPSEEKAPPRLIGSVEEYHRLVKEGVISSKAKQSAEQTGDSKSDAKTNEASAEDDLGPIDCLKNIASQRPGRDTRTIPGGSTIDEGSTKKSDRKKSDKKRKSEKSENSKKPRRDSKKDRRSSEVPSKQSISQVDSSRVDDQAKLDTKAVEGDSTLEDGEIAEPSDVEASDIMCKKKEENIQPAFVKKRFHEEGGVTDEVGSGDREEGEVSGKEDGEISESDEDDKSSEPRNNLQCEPSSHETPTEPKEISRTNSSLSSIPLPCKPHMKSKAKSTKAPERNSAAKRFIIRNLQLGKKIPATSKNKKKRKKSGSTKGSASVAPKKSVTPVPYGCLNQMGNNVVANGSIQTVSGFQGSYLPGCSGSTQAESNIMGRVQNTNTMSTAQYDSYYSWAYSQGLINQASGNYGYGTPAVDPNIYKQWEEYYRKLMEACKTAAHASAGTLATPSTETEKSGYTWVFDHSATVSQNTAVQAPADSTADPANQVQPVVSPSEQTVDVSPVPVDHRTEQDRFESWQFRYGLKGLLKEHFIPSPNTGGNQKT